ncbi:IPExxxVDY family protein [Mucilaginibacter sp. Bleaf8]|uniref:IPExxxVDY family protein n=1 Tax=Mucilaginibacter sp. Bleaf8 TaxID=2834430 RepID=UPI001BCFC28D|nr:IPExxxVDY family protein [Mucilaginibacter sp. Bleaf8]MBS7566614.1 IPExxxVDY family protein [Mucilaginibacter sp. Bleaf8]
MTKKILKFEIDLDFALIAITAPLRDYRLCYFINKYLNFDFKKIPDLAVDIYQGTIEPAHFSIYHTHWETTETDFYLIANKGSDGLLIPEMREVDYFLMIRNFIDEIDLNRIISSLNRIQEILAAVKIDPKKIKSRENLLF